MGFLSYARYSVWDYVLCVLAASGLSYTLMVGFYSTRDFLGNPLVAIGLCAVLVLVMFAVAYNFMSAVVGSIGLAVVLCMSVVMAWRASGQVSLFDDAPGNFVFLILIVFLSSLAVFLLSRKRWGVVVLLVVGVLACAIIEYLYWYNLVVPAAAFVVGAATLFAYKGYQQGLVGSETESISFGATSLAALVMVVASLVLSVGVFALVIAPLNPPNVIVKLMTEHVRMDEVHLRGASDSVDVLNEMEYSRLVDSNQEPTAASTNNNGELSDGENNESQSESEAAVEAGSTIGLDDYADKDAGEAITLNVPNWVPFLVAGLVVLLVVLVFALRKYLRRRRVESIRALEPGKRAEGMFLLVLEKLHKMKVPAPASLTMSEYIESIRTPVARFERIADSSAPRLNALVDVYSRVVYGKQVPTDEELARFDSYYATFYANAWRYVGPLKYVVMFFRI